MEKISWVEEYIRYISHQIASSGHMEQLIQAFGFEVLLSEMNRVLLVQAWLLVNDKGDILNSLIWSWLAEVEQTTLVD